jgi:AraC-like DNA-binding protein
VARARTTRPFTESHGSHCLALVRSGSFGYRVGRARHELVPGSVLVGRPGDEYVCTHEHRLGGDRCLSFHFAPAVVDELAPGRFATTALAPLAELGVLGALAVETAEGRASLGLDEAALRLVARFASLTGGRRTSSSPSPTDRKRAIRAALFVDSHSAEALRLDRLAADAGSSPFHFLRMFTRVIGVTPHQYLIRTRLRKAATLLADERRAVTDVALSVGFGDLSNFVRTFHRAAGVSPRAFRHASKDDRKIFQERIAAAP